MFLIQICLRISFWLHTYLWPILIWDILYSGNLIVFCLHGGNNTLFPFCRKLSSRLGGQPVLDFYQEPSKLDYHFCYVNSHRNYVINQVEQLFQEQSATMFVNNEVFTIHPLNQSCSLHHAANSQFQTGLMEPNESLEEQVYNFVTQTYPKNKYLPLVFKSLIKHNLIDDDLFFVNYPTIHIADFCAFINNSFGSNSSSNNNKNTKTNNLLLKLCKYIRTKHIKFPVICIKNPLARQALM